MSQDRVMTSFVRTWLEDGVDVLPEGLLAEVIAELPSTHQRDAWRPWWRRPISAGGLRFAAAAAAIILVAGIFLVAYSSKPGIVASSPSPSPIYLPPSPGILPPGTVVIDDPFPIGLELTVGPDWKLSSDGVDTEAAVIYRGGYVTADGRGLIIAVPTQLYNDNCRPQEGTFDPGPSASDFAEAINEQQERGGFQNILHDVTLDGYSGKSFRITSLISPIDHSLGDLCTSGNPRWPTTHPLPRSAALQVDDYWVLDVAGQRLVIDAYHFDQAPAGDVAELQQMVESIQIYPR